MDGGDIVKKMKDPISFFEKEVMTPAPFSGDSSVFSDGIPTFEDVQIRVNGNANAAATKGLRINKLKSNRRPIDTLMRDLPQPTAKDPAFPKEELVKYLENPFGGSDFIRLEVDTNRFTHNVFSIPAMILFTRTGRL